MTIEARDRVEADAEEQDAAETPVLADWLMGQLRVSRSEVPPAEPELPVEPAEPAEPLAASTDEEFSEAEAAALEGAALDGAATEPGEQPTTLTPQVLPVDEAEDFGLDDAEEDPAAAFLAQEQRARRKQRTALAAFALIMLALLLVVGMRLRPKAPAPAEPSAAAAPAPAAPEVPALAATAANPSGTPDPALENATERAGNSVAARLWMGVGAPAPAASAPAGVDPLGGPSIARYPDLPRDVLIQLEKAAETTQQPAAQP